MVVPWFGVVLWYGVPPAPGDSWSVLPFWSFVFPLPPLREYLPKKGWAINGWSGLAKSPQNLAWAVFM